jgi:hypothetical protein
MVTMITTPFENISKADIDGLVSRKIAERRTLDYKEVLPGNSDDEKREFLYDVSSFANASGGDLVFGVRDQKDATGKPTGIPEAADGIAVANVAAEIARLENIIQSSIAPRIPGIQFHEVARFTSGIVLIMRIPKSWAAPHMVTFKGATRFYSRNSTGKYPLDVFEIRSAFAQSESLPERLARFRDGRLARILANETPILSTSGSKIVLHCVPLQALDPNSRLDLSTMSSTLSPLLRPMKPGGGWNWRFNFDGFVNYSASGNYAQLFRSGAIEGVEVTALNMKEWRKFTRYDGPDFISFAEFENEVIKATANFLQVQKRLGVLPPIFIMLSLLGVKNFRVTTGPQSFSSDAIDRDSLILPDVLLDEFADAAVAVNQASTILKPVFDAVAQAAGLAGSFNYDINGNRIAQN